jgi:transcriptional regulator with XRE-family HTH domain
VLRAARGMRGLSQRQLADISGVPRTTVERIEAGRVSPGVNTLDNLLGAIGFELFARTKLGRRLPLDEQREQLRDRGGRHFPAHLPLEEMTTFGEGSSWWGWFRIAWWITDPAVPEYTYWRRRRRDLPLVGEERFNAPGYVWEDAT